MLRRKYVSSRRLPLGCAGRQARWYHHATSGLRWWTRRACRSRGAAGVEHSDGILVPGVGSRGRGARSSPAGSPRQQIRTRDLLGCTSRSRSSRGTSPSRRANSTEMDPETPYPVIDHSRSRGFRDLGGHALGAQAVELVAVSRSSECRETVVHDARPATSLTTTPTALVDAACRSREPSTRPPGRDRRAFRPSVVRRGQFPPEFKSRRRGRRRFPGLRGAAACARPKRPASRCDA